MKCEYCDSEVRIVPDNGICPNCGGVMPGTVRQTIPLKQDSKPLFPHPPFEIVRNHVAYLEEGYLKFDKSSVRLVTRLPKVPKKDIIIPYHELFDVSYVPASKHFIGFLCVRIIADRHIPLPQTRWKKKLTDTMIWFTQKDNDDFYRAFVFLKEIARINASMRGK